MNSPRLFAFLAFIAILGVPFLMRSAAPSTHLAAAPRVIIITPHVRQISEEFTGAFRSWHRRTYGTPADIDWRGPLGTSEIIKLLQAQYGAHLKREIERISRESPERLLDPALSLTESFSPGDIGFDIAFGGGSFDHARLKPADSASVSVLVLPSGGVEQVVITKPVEALEAASLDRLRELRALVTLPGRAPVRLRIPIHALEGGLEALRPFTYGAAEVIVRVNTALLQRECGVPMSTPAQLTPEELAPITPNKIGAERLYDPEQYWIGTALSSFGIVYNRDMFKERGLDEPRDFADLADPRLLGLVALADPRQSGSLTTAIDMLLSSYAWRAAQAGGWLALLAERNGIDAAIAAGHGPEVDAAWNSAWRTLREIGANARYYASSSTKPPIDVSVGEAAAGLAIDFYGKSQAQATLRAGEDPLTGRVGYCDPIGQSNFDADPVSILRGGPNQELARRFVVFCLTEEAQALWQFRAHDATNPKTLDGHTMGPEQYELRRLPVRRDLYERYQTHMIDRIDPFKLAPDARPVGWRDAIAVMLPAFSVDILDAQRDAWKALTSARADPAFPASALARMESLFYAFPGSTLPDGRVLEFVPKDFPALARAWRDSRARGAFKREYSLGYTEFFRDNYRQVVALAAHPH